MSQMTFPLRVLVIGGGLGGLCLAQSLLKAGINVTVYERDNETSTRHQGYRVHIDTRGEQALHECLPPDLYELFLATRAQESKGLTVFSIVDGQLKEVVTRYFPTSGSNEFVTVGHAVDRLILRQILLAGLDDVVHFGKEFTHYEQQLDGTINACFADGTSATGDVLVAADGVGSCIREQFLPHAEVIDTGVRWLGGKALLTNELKALLPTQLFETFGSVPGAGRSLVFGLVVFPQNPIQAIAHMRPGLQLHDTADYVFWGALVQQNQLAISDDELNTLPGPDLQSLVLAPGVDWPLILRTLIEQCGPDQAFILKMRHAKQIEHWQTTNITLLGDAIHVMLPNGSGANTALRDASLLARYLIAVASLGMPLHQALHDYEIEMLRYGFDAVQASLQRGKATR